MATKLTEIQTETLKKLKDSNFEFHPYRGRGTHNRYTVKNPHSKVRLDSVKKLETLGLAKRVKEEHIATVSNRHEITITTEGIKFLEGIE